MLFIKTKYWQQTVFDLFWTYLIKMHTKKTDSQTRGLTVKKKRHFVVKPSVSNNGNPRMHARTHTSAQSAHKTFTDGLFRCTNVRQFQSGWKSESDTESGWTAAMTGKANGSVPPRPP